MSLSVNENGNLEGNLACSVCNEYVFVQDMDRPYYHHYYLPIGSVWFEGKTIWHTSYPYMKCKNCGWQLPFKVEKCSDTVTITFYPKSKPDA